MSQVTRIVQAVAKVDSSAADEMCRIALFETLLDIIEANPEVTEIVKNDLKVTNAALRKDLVRKFVDARLAKTDVTPLLQAAAHLSLVDYEIAKADGWEGTDEENLERHHEARGQGGRFVSLGQKVLKPMEGDKQAQIARAQRNANVVQGLMRSRAGMEDAHPAYRAASTLGRTLSATGHFHSGLALDAAAQLGPEAERVFGDHIQRLAYRYRGTERRPDAALTKQMDATLVFANSLSGQRGPEAQKAALAEVGGAEGLAMRPGATPKGQVLDADAGIARYVLSDKSDRDRSIDQTKMDLRAAVATHYLMGRIPGLDEANLSMKAGKMPPSEGVLFNAKGEVVSQAVGFNGDHYLPFDLKNLGRLHGGQYVRTRTTGGLTTEDIYTGLMTGARKVTVVSNSGVFTLEFDKDLRGGRRYNDKARQMVKRYQDMLKAINEGQVTAGKVPDAELRAARQDALERAERAGDMSLAPKLFETRRKELEAKHLFMGEDEGYRAEAREQALAEIKSNMNRGLKNGQTSPQALARLTRDLEGEKAKEYAAQNYRQVRLDAHGYYRAMRALQTEFPYFVRDVDYEPLAKWQADRGLLDYKTGDVRFHGAGGTDIGHVKAHQITHGRDKKQGLSAATRAQTAAQSVNSNVKEGERVSTGLSAAPLADSAKKSFGDEQDLPYERGQKIEMAKQAVKDPDVLNSTVEPTHKPEKLADTRKPHEVLEWANGRHAEEVFEQFKAMSPQQQTQWLASVTSLPAAEGVTATKNDPDEAARIHEAMTELAKGLVQVAPFREGPSNESIRQRYTRGPSADHLRPLNFPEITDLGPDERRLAAWKETKSGPLQAAIDSITQDSNAEVRVKIDKAIETLERAEHGHKASPPTASAQDVEDAQHQLLTLQKAFTYKKAVEMARPPGKAPAQGEPVTAAKRLGDPREQLRLALAEVLRQA